MADIKFTCPHCKQQIECDQLWGGHEINCPTCQGTMMVPQMDAAPAGGKPLAPKPPAGTPRLSAGQTQVARSSSGIGAPQKPFQPPPVKKKNPLVTYALVGLGVAALGAGGYYGYDYYQKRAEKVKPPAVHSRSRAEREAANRPVGGEVGGALDVNDALNGTAPDRPTSSLKDSVNKSINRRRTKGVPSAGDSAAALADDARGGGKAAPTPSDKDWPVVPPVHTMDVSSVNIPVSKVNGVISGGAFLADKARIDKGATYYSLTLRQGAGATPDRAVQVFFHLQPTEGPTNQNITVSADSKDPAISQVVKLWKTGTGFAPNSQRYTSNFALKLELGKMDKGIIPGKIFLALDDTDKTVVAGQFLASLVIPDPSKVAAQSRNTNTRQADNSASAARRKNRYGTQ
jgi:hypothetical protein